jgi:hypothetical protein
MAFAGTVPLLARIPSPVTEPRTGRNVPADAGAARRICATRWLTRPAKPHLPRTASAALTMLMFGFFPQ